jgi:hypothetical protein
MSLTPFTEKVLSLSTRHHRHGIGEYSEPKTEGQLPVSLLIPFSATGLSC